MCLEEDMASSPALPTRAGAGRGGHSPSPARGVEGQLTASVLLSSDSSQHAPARVSSREFDELMQDSVRSEPAAAGPAGAATPRPLDPASPEADGPPAACSSASPEATLAASSALLRKARPGSPTKASSPSPRIASPVLATPPQSPTRQGVLAPPLDLAATGDAPGSWLVTRFADRVEDIARELKRAAVHEFALAEGTLSATHGAQLESERRRAAAREEDRRVEAEVLRAELRDTKAALEAAQRRSAGALALQQRSRRRFLGRSALGGALRLWRALALTGRHDKVKGALAGRLAGALGLANALAAWRHHMQEATREKVVAHERLSAEVARTKLVAEMQRERGLMSTEIERLKKLLAQEADQRMLLQENLKRVFMRGVCALNFEAMSLLSEQTGATGGGAAEPAVPQPEKPGPGPFDWAAFEAQTKARATLPLTAGSRGIGDGALGLKGSTLEQSTTLGLQEDAASAVEAARAVLREASVTASLEATQVSREGQELAGTAAGPPGPEAQAAPSPAPPSAEPGEGGCVVAEAERGPRAPPSPDACPLPFVSYTGPGPDAAAAAAPLQRPGPQARPKAPGPHLQWHPATPATVRPSRAGLGV